jgi:hypothetical protein
MQRCLLLLLLLLSSFGVRAMEEEYPNFFRTLQSLPTSLGTKNVSLSPMQEIQESKNNFVNQLQISMLSAEYWSPVISGLFLQRPIQANPVEFLKYCYYFKAGHYVNNFFSIDLSHLDQDVSLLNMCKNTCIDGYSALGAALLAEGMYIEYKKCFINELLRRNFTFTEKDITLIALHLHDVIPAEQKQMIISLLHGHQESDLAMFPHDIKRCIVDYIVHLHKKSDWLCLLLNKF